MPTKLFFSISIPLVLLFAIPSTYASRCSKKMESIYGKALVNHTYNTIEADNLGDCLMRCAQDFSDKCRSTNWDIMTSKCELNNAKYEDHKVDLMDKDASVYMTSIVTGQSVLMTKPSIPTEKKNAAKSCQDILQSGRSMGDGEYSIDPESTGNPIKVYCDMSTEGGGWILIKNRTLSTPVPSIALTKSDDYRDISKHSQLDMYLSIKALSKLRTVIGAKQLRWFCTKKRDGSRIFHVMTKTNTEGTKVFEYFTDSSKTYRTACGSFDKLADDNSMLSQNCRSWGKDGDRLRVDKWNWEVNQDMRIFRNVARWENNYAFGMYKDEFSCDDQYNSAKSTVSTGDRWLVYIR
ncbi:uncharacterized protein LOC110231748 isoform X2 [Exaiptasia diaphana]|nr:uncharacterized protein LOC110231748 isoform X2 [Exaiptasia diaphana]